MSDANDAIGRRLEAAEQESFHTCEVCGQGENGGKAVGLGLCTTSITLADRKQEAAARSEYFRGFARFYPDTVLWEAPNAVSNC